MLLVAVLLVLTWMLWRLYRFTLIPLLRPQEVKELPYWIPFLGHAISLYRDIDGTITHGREYFGNTRATFSITVAGQKIYIMTSALNISAALNNLRDFDNAKPKIFLMRRFGISKEAIGVLYENPSALPHMISKPSPKSLAAISESLIHRQLTPGPCYEAFESVFLQAIQQRVSPGAIPPEAVVPSAETKPGMQAMSLSEFVRQTFVKSNMLAFFGPALQEINPQFGNQFLHFDDKIQTLLKKLPSPWPSAAEVAMEKPIWSLKVYLELPEEERIGQSWVVSSLEAELRSKGIGTEDIAKWLFMLFWGSNTTTWRLAFWVSAHLLYDPSLMMEIRREIATATENHTSFSSLHKQLSRCTRLMAVYHEVLRFVDSVISIRESTCPQLSALGEQLPAGGTVMLTHRQLLMDEEVWGPDAKAFNAERFLHRDDLTKSKSFTPFGGGALLCPGRFMARGEVLCFVAFLLDRFDIETTQPFPRLDTRSNAGSGILGIKEGDDAVLLVRQRI
ncbi:cytochrome P450 [Xylaria arbuscula]|nr:cytochrome P450 [Xylaria arbuscula]